MKSSFFRIALRATKRHIRIQALCLELSWLRTDYSNSQRSVGEGPWEVKVG